VRAAVWMFGYLSEEWLSVVVVVVVVLVAVSWICVVEFGRIMATLAGGSTLMPCLEVV